jgi:quinol monooxygenase YgiN
MSSTERCQENRAETETGESLAKLRSPKHLKVEELSMKSVPKSFAVTLAILSSIFLVSGLDAEDKSEPITIVSHVDIKPDAYMPQAEENSWRLFRAEAAATKQDAGLVSYVVLQETDATNHFTIVETWRDAKAYEMHVGSRHTVQFRDEIQPFLGSPFDSRIHRQFR